MPGRLSSSVTLLFFFIFTSAAVHAKSANSVYLNGKIYTVDQEQPWAEAVVVKDGRFLYVGDSDGAKSYIGDETKLVNLEGRLVMPGIHDAHSHMVLSGVSRKYECKLPQDADEQEIIAGLKECGKGKSKDEWIVAGLVWSRQFAGQRFDKSFLDEAFPDTPVYIIEGTYHHGFVNSKALEVTGITESTVSPQGGRLLKDENGKLTGEIVEEATYLVSRHLVPASKSQRLEALRWVTRLFSEYGITSTQESSGNAAILETYKTLDAEQALNQRVAGHIIWSSPSLSGTSVTETEQLIEARHQYASEHLKMDFVKIFVDGTPFPPFLTDVRADVETEEVDPTNLLNSAEKIKDMLVEMDQKGIKVKLHVAGSGSARVALDAIAAARKANPDSKIIHDLAHSHTMLLSDIKRMKELNVVADMSPAVWHDAPPVLANLPTWQFRSMDENGVMMTIGTDWGVLENPNVFPALQGLMERDYESLRQSLLMHFISLHSAISMGWKNVIPTIKAMIAHDRESLDMETALNMLTINGAISMGWQEEMGSIEQGKLANFIVLDRNLFEVPAAEIGGTQVLRTVFEGRTVYESFDHGVDGI